MAILKRQPFKGVYLVYQLVALAVLLPIWTITNVPRSLRPKSTWTLKKTIGVYLLKRVMKILMSGAAPVTFLPNHLAITPGTDIHGIWIEPVQELITGKLEEWADKAEVISIRIPGYWTHKKGSDIEPFSPPQPGEKIVYALHGGAYVRLSGHPTDVTGNIGKGFLKYVDKVTRVFSPEYRLAVGKPNIPQHSFPTQLIDALAGYNYLVNVVGFSPDDIIVEGDSAGGNLAHALTRYLVEYQGDAKVKIPGPPSALILTSPWADLGEGHEILPNGSAKKFLGIDYLPGDGAYAKGAFTGVHGLSAASTNPYVSPASLDPSFEISFKGFPRTFIIGGGAELLLDCIRTLKERMIKDLGEGDGVKEGDGKVRYYEAPDAVHDYLCFQWSEPERSQTFQAINAWLDCS